MRGGGGRTPARARTRFCGWKAGDAVGGGETVDRWLAPADAGRGRPYPDLVLTALLRLKGSRVRALAVAGDTAADVLCGRNAGAGLVAGVLTGAHDEDTLQDAGADEVVS